MKSSTIAAWMVGAAIVLAGARSGADLPGGTSAGAWLDQGGAILDLQVAPAGARVELDGDRIQAGPALVTPGVHLLVVRATGRREHREVVRVPAGRRFRKRIALAPLPQTGRLDLRVRPRHARVLIDGRLVGAPDRPIVLTAGRHRLQLVATGYRTLRRVVRVLPGATLTVRFDLRPDRRRRRRPRVAMQAVLVHPSL